MWRERIAGGVKVRYCGLGGDRLWELEEVLGAFDQEGYSAKVEAY